MVSMVCYIAHHGIHGMLYCPPWYPWYVILPTMVYMVRYIATMALHYSYHGIHGMLYCAPPMVFLVCYIVTMLEIVCYVARHSIHGVLYFDQGIHSMLYFPQ